jgi:hypothetical protein
MDRLRSCYKTTIRPFHDSDDEAEITWFWCEPGAKAFPDWHRFASGNWAPDRLGWNGPGEIAERPRTYVRGKKIGRATGDHYCGTLAMFQQGASRKDPPLPLDAAGEPRCCYKSPGGVFVGGTGHPRQAFHRKGSGSFRLQGKAPYRVAARAPASGGFILSGTAPFTAPAHPPAGGTFRLIGTARVVVTPTSGWGGAIILGGLPASLPFVGPHGELNGGAAAAAALIAANVHGPRGGLIRRGIPFRLPWDGPGGDLNGGGGAGADFVAGIRGPAGGGLAGRGLAGFVIRIRGPAGGGLAGRGLAGFNLAAKAKGSGTLTGIGAAHVASTVHPTIGGNLHLQGTASFTAHPYPIAGAPLTGGGFTGNFSVGRPGSSVAGDLIMVGILQTSSTVLPTTASGFTMVTSQTYNGGVGVLSVWTKTDSGSDPVSYVFSHSGIPNTGYSCCRIKPAAGGLDGSSTNTGNASTFIMASLTTSGPARNVFLYCADGAGSNVTGGFVQLNSGNLTIPGCSYKTIASAGPTGSLNCHTVTTAMAYVTIGVAVAG